MKQTLRKKMTAALCGVLILFSFLLPSIPVQAGTIPFIILSEYNKTLQIGEEHSLIAVTSTGKKPTFKSSDSSVASVSTYGVITAKKGGTAKITAKISGAEATCCVTVKKTTIKLNKTSVSLECNATAKLSATVSTKANVTWKSSKSSVASVDENGVITAKKPGETEIKATAQGTTSICKVKVKSPTIVLNKRSVTLYRLGCVRLTAKVSSGKTPTWKTNKKSVATVSISGLVKAQKHGTATITATVDGVSKTCTITVKQPTVQLSESSITLNTGESHFLTAKVSSGNQPEWSTSNENVAAVSTMGKVTAVSAGRATIYCKEDGVKKSCTVKVVQPK